MFVVFENDLRLTYIYGLVFPDDDLFAQIGRGDIGNRGCCIEFDSPQWFNTRHDTDHP